jgi:uncharacterized membrane protein
VVRRDASMARTAGLALGVGFGIAVPVTAVAAAGAWAIDLIPDDALTNLSGVEFVYQVGPFSLVVALLAGIAGMVALVAGEGSGVLVGVFISVTTVPAAGDFALSLAVGATDQLAGSAAQLGINLAGMTVAGVVTLVVQRLLWRAVISRRRSRLGVSVGAGRV